MAYSEALAQRIRPLLPPALAVSERKMFGGLAFMLNGNMFVGILGDTLMARVGPQQHAEALQLPHVREMDFTGKPMKGYVYVAAEGITNDAALTEWLNRCRTFAATLPAK